MTIEERMHELETLRRNFTLDLRDVDPNLSAEGQKKRQDSIRDDYKRKLDRLTQQFESEVARAKLSAREAIPAAPGDTSAAWKRVEMLLEAGAGISDVVAEADPDTLHAISEWGGTYLQAKILKSGPSNRDAMTKLVDPDALKNGVRQRWAQLLDGYKPEYIQDGIKAEAAEAQFGVTAENLQGQFAGWKENRSRDARSALVAGFAGRPATLPGIPSGNNAA